MCSYRDLLVWRRALDLAEVIHRATVSFPQTERWGLTAQLRGRATAVPAQLAGDYGPRGATFVRGLTRARRTLQRLECQILIATRLRYWSPRRAAEIARRLVELRGLIQALLRALRPGDVPVGR